MYAREHCERVESWLYRRKRRLKYMMHNCGVLYLNIREDLFKFVYSNVKMVKDGRFL